MPQLSNSAQTTQARANSVHFDPMIAPSLRCSIDVSRRWPSDWKGYT